MLKKNVEMEIGIGTFKEYFLREKRFNFLIYCHEEHEIFYHISGLTSSNISTLRNKKCQKKR